MRCMSQRRASRSAGESATRSTPVLNRPKLASWRKSESKRSPFTRIMEDSSLLFVGSRFTAQLFDMSAQSSQPFAQLRVGNGESNAHVAVATRPECYTRHHGGAAARQQVAREFERAQPGRSYIDEGVKGALGDGRQQAGISEHIDHDVAPPHIGVAKIPCARLIAVERGLARLLGDGGSAGGDGLLQP